MKVAGKSSFVPPTSEYKKGTKGGYIQVEGGYKGYKCGKGVLRGVSRGVLRGMRRWFRDLFKDLFQWVRGRSMIFKDLFQCD